MTTDFAKSVKIDSHTREISIMCGDRIAFNIRIQDGHTIEIGGGTCVKDNDIIYAEGLQISPSSCSRIKVSKVRYD
jgi:RNase P/RNase MRP subunit p29